MLRWPVVLMNVTLWVLWCIRVRTCMNVYPSPPFYRIGTGERKNLAMGNPEVPGPGAYHNPHGQRSQKGAKIGTSNRPGLHPTFGQQIPGPGAYEVRAKSQGPQFPMGIKTAAKKNNEKMPGPGEYDAYQSAYLEKNSGAVIGTSVRPELNRNEKTPGPGTYKWHSVKEVGPKWRFAMGKRYPNPKSNDEPGPGSYNIPSAFGNVPKYLLPKRSESESKFF